MSFMNKFVDYYVTLARKASPQAFLLAGGIGPSLNPSIYLENGFNAVIRGEGEQALLDLVKKLSTQQPWKDSKNLCYLQDNALITNHLYPVEKNLDTFPIPLSADCYFSYIDNDTLVENKKLIYTDNYITLTSRGCIGKCSYCAAPTIKDMYKDTCGLPIRTRSIEHIFSELKEIKRIGTQNIFFGDDFFVRPMAELKEFFIRYKQDIAISFSMYLHPQQVLKNKELLELAFAAGLRSVCFGIQHVSKAVCEGIYNRKNFCKDLNDYALIAKKANTLNLSMNLHLILGNPLETEEDFQECLNFAKLFPICPSLRPTVRFHCMYLYYMPGSPLIKQYPNLHLMPRSYHAWLRQCILIELRQMLNDVDFDPVYTDKNYEQDVQSLLTLRHTTLAKMHEEYIQTQAHKLKNQEVYFFGAGKVYEQRKSLFNQCKPQAIIVDRQYTSTAHTMDNIPTAAIEDIHKDIGQKPLILFLHKEKLHPFLRRLKRTYPHITNIITCTEHSKYIHYEQ